MPQDTSLRTREHFPALQQYVYLNAASIAMVPAPVRQKQEEYEREIGSVGTVSLDEEAESRATDLPRRLLADLFGTEESRIALVSNATEALSHLAWGIRPQRGTNVVVIDLDFPSTVYPWMRAAQDTGAEVRLVRAMEDPRSLCIEDIAAAVDDDTTAVCISEVQYATGHRFDLGLLAELAHDAGALCIVDGTQSAGVVPVDVEESDVDAFVASGYKWLCAPFGAAAMYVHPRLMGSIDPPIAGWRSTRDIFAFDATRLDFIDDARKFHAGTPSYGAMFALGEIARYLLDLGVDTVFEHVLSLT
ncbi:MAG: aminotransferase class V-fold PLP-dependent enzyme, partial [Bacillota bacterium]